MPALGVRHSDLAMTSNSSPVASGPQQNMAMIQHQTVCGDTYGSLIVRFEEDFLKGAS
jgi:hypothetical protein